MVESVNPALPISPQWWLLALPRSSVYRKPAEIDAEQLVTVIQESLSVAHRTGALRTGRGRHHGAAQSDRASDRRAALSSRLEKLVDLARRHHVSLRQR
jgi:hypothetical protein